MLRFLAVGLVISAAGIALAADAPPPKWDITEACAGAGGTGPCPRVESDARRSLLDRWTALPVDMRAARAREVEAEGQRSYRRLAACIDDLAFKAFDAQRNDGAKPSAPTAQ
ncbi:MAG: hypothetical protein ACT4OU_09355 [Hyphomicrobium sp.]